MGLENQNSSFENRERPKTLFIGSHVSGLKEIIPTKGNMRNKNEGPVIFSTPDKALASIFLINDHNDSWTQIGYYGGTLSAVIRMNREEFLKRDNGGTVYEVPSDTFDFNPSLGMGDKEWTSSVSVKPNSEIKISSVLDEMIENGVQVYFVDSFTFEEIKKAEDHGLSILLGLESENKLRGMNIKALKI